MANKSYLGSIHRKRLGFRHQEFRVERMEISMIGIKMEILNMIRMEIQKKFQVQFAMHGLSFRKVMMDQ